MLDRIAYLWPELTLFITAIVVIFLGTSKDKDFRRISHWVAGIGIFIAMALGTITPTVEGSLFPGLAVYAKPMICLIGIILLLGMGSIDTHLEADIKSGKRIFDPLDNSRGEFMAFFLLSLIGLMLTTVAEDLIWLFLALELTSLPTYVMVAASRRRSCGHESSVKYFYLGALAAAFFLYGFAMLYGATGSLHLVEIRAAFIEQSAASPTGSINPIGLLGLILAFVGVAYKIAAFPMHFYAADVYEGAATPVSAFLAFVPKAAGFIVIMLLMGTILGLHNGDSVGVWPAAIHDILWIIAVITMVIGNTLALLQKRVKRILAYSSIAHSGYMMIGIIAGPGVAVLHGGDIADSLTTNGFAAVLFYIMAYGIMNIGAFMVLACLEDRGEEIETLDDLAGIARSHPWLGVMMAICCMSLLGLPPLVGFFGKMYLFSSGIAAGEIVLVVIAGLNSAVSAWYYLKLAGLPWLVKPTTRSERMVHTPYIGRRVAAALSAIGVIVLIFAASSLMEASNRASQIRTPDVIADTILNSASDEIEVLEVTDESNTDNGIIQKSSG